MKLIASDLPEVLIVQPQVFADKRGQFSEVWVRDRYLMAGIPTEFVQDNFTRSVKGALRGLHFQEPDPQGKLLTVLAGRIFDVVVDIRVDGANFGRAVTVELDSEGQSQIWIPPGFAHGFCVLSERADCFYKCTAPYNPSAERAIRWNDPDLAIDWPIADPILSDRDSIAPLLADAPMLPHMSGPR
jgi:dTDP-4-dehydrorhamnose 3,5-epimerase